MYFVCRLKKMKTIEQLKTDLAAATKEKADADAALVVAEKQKAEAEKKRVDAEAGFITFVISGAGGLVSKCRIPIAAVAQRGLFRIMFGSSGVSVTNITVLPEMDIPPYLMDRPLYKGDYYPILSTVSDVQSKADSTIGWDKGDIGITNDIGGGILPYRGC